MDFSSRRIQKELTDIVDGNLGIFRDIEVDEESDSTTWRGLILPRQAPFNMGAFKIEINFPPEFPFKPPGIKFITKIYHPNVGEKGQIYLPITNSRNWSPSVKMQQVIEELVAIIDNPKLDVSLRLDLGMEYVKNKDKFIKCAEEYVAKYAEKLPSGKDNDNN